MKEKPKDNEARMKWYQYGEDLEKLFISTVAPSLHLPIIINPKKKKDPTVIDMTYLGKFPADLKTQNTPFFTANKYGVPPQFAVTFNHKDYTRYKKLYPFAIIFFWIEWKQLSWKGKNVKPMHGLWKVPFWKIVRDIENGSVKLHTYQKRSKDSRPNAKDSYVLDLRNYTEIWRE